MKKFTKIIDKAVETLLILLMAVITLDVIWQVFTRFILNSPSSYTEELAGFLLIWIGILGSAYAYKTKAHLGIDILQSKLGSLKKQILQAAVHCLVSVFAFCVMVVGGLRLVKFALELNQISSALGIKMGYVYIVIPLSGMLIIYYSACFIIDLIKGLDNNKSVRQFIDTV